MSSIPSAKDHAVIDSRHLDDLFAALTRKGYRIVGPTIREGAIVYDDLASSADLPEGWTDEQDGGVYRLKKRADRALFGYAVGPHSWKKFLSPPEQRLWRAELDGKDFKIIAENGEPPKFAFIGVRSCELHAIAIQDKIFLQGTHTEPAYRVRRENAFIVAVNCHQAGGTCFCVSMNTGPRAESGFDLALTEIVERDRHYFVVEAGSAPGREILKDVPHTPARTAETAAAEQTLSRTAAQMGRTLDTTDIKELLYQNYDHARWDDVA